MPIHNNNQVRIPARDFAEFAVSNYIEDDVDTLTSSGDWIPERPIRFITCNGTAGTVKIDTPKSTGKHVTVVPGLVKLEHVTKVYQTVDKGVRATLIAVEDNTEKEY